MNEKTIAAIALTSEDFPSFEAKLHEAVRWIEHAAGNGAQLVVLPESLSAYRGDGPNNPHALAFEQIVLDDWTAATQPLFEVARRCRVAVTVPILVREGSAITNSFFLISAEGQVLGRYDKICPTPAELECGVVPGNTPKLIEWEGLHVGGAICFDTLFEEVFRCQVQMGAELFLVPSLWPGGDALNHYARKFSTPIALAYPAWSRIIDITGQDAAATGYRNETLRFGFGTPVAMATINFDRVTLYGDGNERQMAEVERRYGTRVRVRFDQQNTLFFLESRTPDLTVADVMKEFGLVSSYDYLTACEGKARARDVGPCIEYPPRSTTIGARSSRTHSHP